MFLEKGADLLTILARIGTIHSYLGLDRWFCLKVKRGLEGRVILLKYGMASNGH
ncbi:hypothetical protein MTKAM_09020 [Moorella thermoacetica]